jgi:hypothetical protein
VRTNVPMIGDTLSVTGNMCIIGIGENNSCRDEERKERKGKERERERERERVRERERERK